MSSQAEGEDARIKKELRFKTGYVNKGATHLTRRTLFVSPSFQRAGLLLWTNTTRMAWHGMMTTPEYHYLSIAIHYYPVKRKQCVMALDRSHIIRDIVPSIPH